MLDVDVDVSFQTVQKGENANFDSNFFSIHIWTYVNFMNGEVFIDVNSVKRQSVT